MELKILNASNKDVGKVTLPSQFNEPVRADLIIRSVLGIESRNRQKYGNDPDAGMKHSAELSRRRRKYRGSYGFGISRVPRKILSRRGTRFNWVGALAPGTVGGRRAHPPKTERIWDQKVNKKENRKAIRSAIAATVISELVSKRGHQVPPTYPFALSDDFEKLTKTKDIQKALEALGLLDELSRAKVKTIRAGRGTMRGRRYKRKKGPLFVVSELCALSTAAKNIPGVDVTTVEKLNVKLLAPGSQPGRLTLFTKKALARMEKDNLFN